MDFISQLPTIAGSVADMLVKIFTSISSIFYTAAEGGGSGSLTFIGAIALVVLFIGLSLQLVNWVRSLVARR